MGLFRRGKKIDEEYVLQMLQSSAQKTSREWDAIQSEDVEAWLTSRPVYERLSASDKQTAVRLLKAVKDKATSGADLPMVDADVLRAYAAIEAERAFEHEHNFMATMVGVGHGTLVREAEGTEALPMPSAVVERAGSQNPEEVAVELVETYVGDEFDDQADGALGTLFGPGLAVWNCVQAWVSEWVRLVSMSAGGVAVSYAIPSNAPRIGYALAALREQSGQGREPAEPPLRKPSADSTTEPRKGPRKKPRMSKEAKAAWRAEMEDIRASYEGDPETLGPPAGDLISAEGTGVGEKADGSQEASGPAALIFGAALEAVQEAQPWEFDILPAGAMSWFARQLSISQDHHSLVLDAFTFGYGVRIGEWEAMGEANRLDDAYAAKVREHFEEDPVEAIYLSMSSIGTKMPAGFLPGPEVWGELFDFCRSEVDERKRRQNFAEEVELSPDISKMALGVGYGLGMTLEALDIPGTRLRGDDSRDREEVEREVEAVRDYFGRHDNDAPHSHSEDLGSPAEWLGENVELYGEMDKEKKAAATALLEAVQVRLDAGTGAGSEVSVPPAARNSFVALEAEKIEREYEDGEFHDYSAVESAAALGIAIGVALRKAEGEGARPVPKEFVEFVKAGSPSDDAAGVTPRLKNLTDWDAEPDLFDLFPLFSQDWEVWWCIDDWAEEKVDSGVEGAPPFTGKNAFRFGYSLACYEEV